MLEQFKCPDGQIIEVSACLAKCRMAERCVTLPTLALISQEREWNGTASTTQLLNGTMYEYLKLTKPYCVDPDSRAFMLQGTKHHKGLEEVAKELGLASEIPLSVDRDIFDLLENEEIELDGETVNTFVLTDYKLWGSFKVAKALGMTKMGKKPDPSGELYKTTGRWGKAGTPKMIDYFGIVEENKDLWEAEYQLNRYRIKLADLGIHIYRMQLQVTVRDGGLLIAHNRGLNRNIYKIPVKKLPDEDVIGFFKYKNDNLQYALKYGWSTPCTTPECWGDDVRCKRYCDVAKYCPKGSQLQGIDYEGESF